MRGATIRSMTTVMMAANSSDDVTVKKMFASGETTYSGSTICAALVEIPARSGSVALMTSEALNPPLTAQNATPMPSSGLRPTAA